MAEAFPSGLPLDALPGLPGRVQGLGLPGTDVFPNADGSTTVRGIPLSSDVAARLNKVLGGAVPAIPAVGPGVPDVLGATRSSSIPVMGQSLGKGLAVPGLTPAQGSGLIEGTANVISVPADAVLGIPQALPLR